MLLKCILLLLLLQVPRKKIRKLVKDFGLFGYVETSALRGASDVDRVFQEATRAAVKGGDDDGVDNGGGSKLFSCFG